MPQSFGAAVLRCKRSVWGQSETSSAACGRSAPELTADLIQPKMDGGGGKLACRTRKFEPGSFRPAAECADDCDKDLNYSRFIPMSMT